MRQADTKRRIARAVERARAATAPTRAARARSAGQTLIIFVLLFTALLGFMGLAIDSARVYDQYARMQRAAESGALAGVIYMPDNYLTPIATSPNDDAICRALREAFKNGFGSGCNPASPPGGLAGLCPTPPTSVEIAVCPVGSDPHELQVFITERVDVVFLSALGIGPLTITATATAQFLPPAGIAVDPGGPGSTGGWGTLGTANGSSCPTTGTVRCWAANVNGPGELKEQGDPLVSCEEGASALSGPANNGGSQDSNWANVNYKNGTPYMTYVGMATNHPQTAGLANGVEPTGCGNPDTGGVFTAPPFIGSSAQRAGYAYYVTVPPSATKTQNLWVWNAPFDPTPPSSCNGRQNKATPDIFYQFNCSGSSGTFYPTYTGTTCPTGAASNPYTCTDPDLYFSVTYTIYQIPNVNSPIAGAQLKASFTAWPYMPNGCPPVAKSAPYLGIVPLCAPSQCAVVWCPVGNQLGDVTAPVPFPMLPGTVYRVMVTTSDYGTPSDIHKGFGAHDYSFRICDAGSVPPNCTAAPGASVGGWGISDALLVFPGNGSGTTQITEYPLAVIGPEFAGRTLDVQMYDPGDLAGTNGAAKGFTSYAVAPPNTEADPCNMTATDLAGYSFTFPNNERTDTTTWAPDTSLNATVQADEIYNGLWTDVQIKVPSTYTGGAWTLCAKAPQTNDNDVVGFRVSALGDSPVHLV